MFSVRIVNADFYTSPPIPGLDVTYSQFRETKVYKVPVVRIFGATKTGQKTCLHLHGVFPYIYVPYDGSQPTDKYLKQFATSVDFAFQVSQGKASSSTHHVYKISVVKGRQYYGYHKEEREFLKISFYNPFVVTRVVDLLQNGAIMNKVFQPHEAHIPYLLQLFMDYNLYGMNFLNSSAVKFRRPVRCIQGGFMKDETHSLNTSSIALDSSPHTPSPPLISPSSPKPGSPGEFWTENTILSEWILGPEVERLSTCELEMDLMAQDILNQLQIGVTIGANPGIAAIWEDERQRRKLEKDDTPLSPPLSQDRGALPDLDAEEGYKEKIRQIVNERDLFLHSQIEKLSKEDISPEELVNLRDIVPRMMTSQGSHPQVPRSPGAELVSQLMSQRDGSPSLQTDGDPQEHEPIVDESIVREVVELSQHTLSQKLGSPVDMEMVEILASLADDGDPSQSRLTDQDYTDDDERGEEEEQAAQVEEEEESIIMSQQVWEDTDRQWNGSGEQGGNGNQDEAVSSSFRFSQFDVEGLEDAWAGSFLGDDTIPQVDGANDDDQDGQQNMSASSSRSRRPSVMMRKELENVSRDSVGQGRLSPKRLELPNEPFQRSKGTSSGTSRTIRRLGMSTVRIHKSRKEEDKTYTAKNSSDSQRGITEENHSNIQGFPKESRFSRMESICDEAKFRTSVEEGVCGSPQFSLQLSESSGSDGEEEDSEQDIRQTKCPQNEVGKQVMKMSCKRKGWTEQTPNIVKSEGNVESTNLKIKDKDDNRKETDEEICLTKGQIFKQGNRFNPDDGHQKVTEHLDPKREKEGKPYKEIKALVFAKFRKQDQGGEAKEKHRSTRKNGNATKGVRQKSEKNKFRKGKELMQSGKSIKTLKSHSKLPTKRTACLASTENKEDDSREKRSNDTSSDSRMSGIDVQDSVIVRNRKCYASTVTKKIQKPLNLHTLSVEDDSLAKSDTVVRKASSRVQVSLSHRPSEFRNTTNLRKRKLSSLESNSNKAEVLTEVTVLQSSESMQHSCRPGQTKLGELKVVISDVSFSTELRETYSTARIRLKRCRLDDKGAINRIQNSTSKENHAKPIPSSVLLSTRKKTPSTPKKSPRKAATRSKRYGVLDVVIQKSPPKTPTTLRSAHSQISSQMSLRESGLYSRDDISVLTPAREMPNIISPCSLGVDMESISDCGARPSVSIPESRGVGKRAGQRRINVEQGLTCKPMQGKFFSAKTEQKESVNRFEGKSNLARGAVSQQKGFDSSDLRSVEVEGPCSQDSVVLLPPDTRSRVEEMGDNNKQQKEIIPELPEDREKGKRKRLNQVEEDSTRTVANLSRESKRPRLSLKLKYKPNESKQLQRILERENFTAKESRHPSTVTVDGHVLGRSMEHKAQTLDGKFDSEIELYDKEPCGVSESKTDTAACANNEREQADVTASRQNDISPAIMTDACDSKESICTPNDATTGSQTNMTVSIGNSLKTRSSKCSGEITGNDVMLDDVICDDVITCIPSSPVEYNVGGTVQETNTESQQLSESDAARTLGEFLDTTNPCSESLRFSRSFPGETSEENNLFASALYTMSYMSPIDTDKIPNSPPFPYSPNAVENSDRDNVVIDSADENVQVRLGELGKDTSSKGESLHEDELRMFDIRQNSPIISGHLVGQFSEVENSVVSLSIPEEDILRPRPNVGETQSDSDENSANYNDQNSPEVWSTDTCKNENIILQEESKKKDQTLSSSSVTPLSQMRIQKEVVSSQFCSVSEENTHTSQRPCSQGNCESVYFLEDKMEVRKSERVSRKSAMKGGTEIVSGKQQGIIVEGNVEAKEGESLSEAVENSFSDRHAELSEEECEKETIEQGVTIADSISSCEEYSVLSSVEMLSKVSSDKSVIEGSSEGGSSQNLMHSSSRRMGMGLVEMEATEQSKSNLKDVKFPMGKADRVTSADEKNVVLIPAKAAPSSKELLKTLSHHGIPQCRHQKPFCSNPDDIPEIPSEVGGRILRIQSKQVKSLSEFDTHSPVIGLRQWRSILCETHEKSFREACRENIGSSGDFISGIEKNPQLRLAFMGDSNVVITPCRAAPSSEAVRTWAREKVIRRKARLLKQDEKRLGEIMEEKKKGLDKMVPKTLESKGNLNRTLETQDICSSKQKNENTNLAEEEREEFSVEGKFEDNSGGNSQEEASIVAQHRGKTRLSFLDQEETNGVKDPRGNVTGTPESVQTRVGVKDEAAVKSPTPGELTSPYSLFSPVEGRFPFGAAKQVENRPGEDLSRCDTSSSSIETAEASVDTPERKLRHCPVDQTEEPCSRDVRVHSLKTPTVPRYKLKFTATNTEDLQPVMSQASPFLLPRQPPSPLTAPHHSTPISSKPLSGFLSPVFTPIKSSQAASSDDAGVTERGSGSPSKQSSSADNASRSAITRGVLRRQLLSSQSKLCTPDARPRYRVEAGSQIEGPSPQNTCGFKIPQLNIQKAKATHEVQHVTLLSIELHVRTRRHLRPDPEFDPICAIFYHVQTDTPCPMGRNKVTGVICVDKESARLAKGMMLDSKNSLGVTHCYTHYVEIERDLFPAFLALIHKWDPDILIGYDVQMLSWGYLIQRALVFDLDLASKLSRVTGSSSDSNIDAEKDKWGASHTSEIKIAGRIVLNVWRLMRHEVTLNVYTFENVTFHVLHERIPLFTYRSLSDWWDHKTDIHRWRTVQHYITRCHGNIRILEQVDFIGRTSELARLFGILFFAVISRGSQYRVESMMLRIAKPMNYIAVSPSVQQRNSMRAPGLFPLVMEPESRFYHDPVLVLDFQSLYPSMIIAYNYCYSTCLGRVSGLAEDGEFKFGVTSLSVPPSLLKRLESDVHVSPNGVAFVKSNIRRGVLPRMLEDILGTRIMVKNSMKKWKQDKSVHRMLDARQLGLKLIANVTYGYTSAHFSGRMPCVEIGDSIVRKARETLEQAIDLVNRTSKWGARVVYGDTDSLFVLLKGVTKDQAFKIGQEITDAVTAMNPKPVKLKFEKVYLPCVLQTKKRYVGYMYETADQKEPVFDAKGIETVRRDTCAAVAKVLEKSLRILFEARDVSLVKQFVQRQLRKVMEARVSLMDLTFAKEYRGMKSYKPGACVPALELTRRMLKEDRRSEPRVGERVPYVIVYGSPGLPLIQLVRRPHEVLQDANLRVNASYYITKQILPPLHRVFSLIGVDVKTWYAELPRVVRITQQPVAQSDTRKGTISQYFSSLNCPVCQEMTREGLCTRCRSDPQKVVVILNDRVREWERTYHHLSEICYQCCESRDPKLCCISIDCPAFHKLVQATRDLQAHRVYGNSKIAWCCELVLTKDAVSCPSRNTLYPCWSVQDCSECSRQRASKRARPNSASESPAIHCTEGFSVEAGNRLPRVPGARRNKRRTGARERRGEKKKNSNVLIYNFINQ